MPEQRNTVLFYREHLFIIGDYWGTVNRSEAIFDFLIPLVGAAITYFTINLPNPQPSETPLVISLTETLISTLSILIGFSAASITILVTADNKNIELLKSTQSRARKLGGKAISLFKLANILFFAVLLSEFIALFFCVILRFNPSFAIHHERIFCALLFCLIMHIILSNVRCFTNLYFVFWKEPPKQPTTTSQ